MLYSRFPPVDLSLLEGIHFYGKGKKLLGTNHDSNYSTGGTPHHKLIRMHIAPPKECWEQIRVISNWLSLSNSNS